MSQDRSSESEQHKALCARLDALAQSMRPAEAPPRVEQALLRAFREKHEARKPSGAWWRVWATAAAVAMLVVAALALRPCPDAPVASDVVAEEIATDYIPMGFARSLAPDEFTHVVRISLPRSEMVRFGFPARADLGESRVKADVVLGEDGIARAIRFVQ